MMRWEDLHAKRLKQAINKIWHLPYTGPLIQYTNSAMSIIQVQVCPDRLGTRAKVQVCGWVIFH
jgi:hypothetical protein